MGCGGSRPAGTSVGMGALRVDVERPRGPAAPFKCVVMGDKSIGKSSIVVRFTKDSFADAGMTATIGAAFAMKDVRVDDGSLARLQIWGALICQRDFLLLRMSVPASYHQRLRFATFHPCPSHRSSLPLQILLERRSTVP